MKKTFFNYISFIHAARSNYRYFFFRITNYFFSKNNFVSKPRFPKYGKLLYCHFFFQRFDQFLLTQNFIFNPNLFTNFNLFSVKLKHLSKTRNFIPNITTKVYYNFIKFTEFESCFNCRFTTINSFVFNKHYINVKDFLYRNFLTTITVLDFRYLFFSSKIFSQGDFFETSDLPPVVSSDLFSIDFVADNNTFFPLGSELNVNESKMFPIEQLDLYVYDDCFDYRIQHRILERSVYLSLFPNSLSTYPKIFMLTSSHELPVLKNFSNLRNSSYITNVNFSGYFSRLNNITQNQTFNKYFKLNIIKSILTNIWNFYYSNINLFVTANNSIYLLLRKFSKIWPVHTEFLAFIKFFTSTNFELNFFNKFLSEALDSFVNNFNGLDVFTSFSLVTKKKSEVFFDDCLFNFSKTLVNLDCVKLSNLHIQILDYCNFCELQFKNGFLVDAGFRTTFLSFLSKNVDQLELDTTPKKIINYLITDFNSKYSSSLSFSQFIPQQSLFRVFNGLDFTFLDNADFVLSEFEFLFRQIAIFDYFFNFEVNLQTFFKNSLEFPVNLNVKQLFFGFKGYKNVYFNKPEFQFDVSSQIFFFSENYNIDIYKNINYLLFCIFEFVKIFIYFVIKYSSLIFIIYTIIWVFFF